MTKYIFVVGCLIFSGCSATLPSTKMSGQCKSAFYEGYTLGARTEYDQCTSVMKDLEIDYKQDPTYNSALEALRNCLESGGKVSK